MRHQSWRWTLEGGWESPSGDAAAAGVVLYFGAREALERPGVLDRLAQAHPRATLVGCSSGGEIFAGDVCDDGIVALALEFARSSVRTAVTPILDATGSRRVGAVLGDELAAPELRWVFVLSDGTRVNGSELVRGLTEAVGPEVVVTGGLAGDGDRFQRTLVGCGGPPLPGQVAAVGVYGERLSIGHGSVGGWDAFGPERLVTRSDGNILYELDGSPALALYKRYLGDEARDLPGSGLLFPLRIRPADGQGSDLVRTIVNVDEAADALVFAGDVPQGWLAQLMKGNFNRLVDGAGEAARLAGRAGPGQGVAILISCIGRKLLLGQRISDETEAIAELLGPDVVQLGFYSYGEISPHMRSGACELHNQTMTVTVLAES